MGQGFLDIQSGNIKILEKEKNVKLNMEAKYPCCLHRKKGQYIARQYTNEYSGY